MIAALTLGVLLLGDSSLFELAEGAPLPVGPMAGEPVLGDFDRDGKLDVVLACGTCCGSRPDPLSGHVALLLGDGAGGFSIAPGMPLKVGSSARKVAAGDVDGDGDLDLAVAQHDSYDVVLLLGDGRGGLAPAPDSPFRAAEGQRPHTHDVALADVDGDGHLDLATTNANDGTVSLLRGDGAASFAPFPDSPVKTERHPYDSIVLADFDGDGRPDLLVPNMGVDRLTLLANRGGGAFDEVAASPFELGPRPGSLVAADFDGDGQLDVAAAHDDDPVVTLLKGDGAGGLAAFGSVPKLAHAVWGGAAGDLDLDGDVDLAFGSQRDRVTLLLGDGKGGFLAHRDSPLQAGEFTGYVALGDLDRDGDVDLVGASYGSGALWVWLNRTRGAGSAGTGG